MSIPIVKNKMIKSYVSIGKLEIDINRLINTLTTINIVEYNNATPIISELIPILNDTLQYIENTIKDTEKELPRFFSVFNKVGKKTIDACKSMRIELEQLKNKSMELDYLYKQYGSEKVLTTYLELESVLQNSIPKLSQFKNELQIFKNMIDFNNNKLKVGVRI